MNRRRRPTESAAHRAVLVIMLVLVPTLVSVAAVPSRDALRTRLGALYARLDARDVAPHLWLAMAEDPHPEVRRTAVHVLAAVADPLLLPVLESYRADGSALVRAEVMVAAGRLGPSGVGLAATGVRDASPGVRQAAAWALAHGGEDGCRVLLTHIPRETAPAVLETIVGQLFRCDSLEWEAAVARVAGSRDPGLRRAAAAALARGAGHPALDDLVGDHEAVIRATALAGFGRGELGKPRAERIAGALSDPDWRVQAAACAVLAARPDVTLDPAAGRRLTSLVEGPHAHLTVVALRALGAHPEAGSARRLRGWTGSDSPWIAAEALDATARRSPDRALPLIASWLGSEDLPRRLAAAAAAARLEGAEARDLHSRIMADPAPAVRLAWVERLEQVPEARAAWFKDRLLADHDPAVRSALLDLLAAQGDLGGRSELLGLYRAWRGDTMGDARTSALLAALALSPDEASRQALVALASDDPDDAVVARLVAAARELGVQVRLPARKPRHPERWYRDLVDWMGEPHWLDVTTGRGTFRIRLDAAAAPISAREVYELARSGFYDGLSVHRVVPNFVVQGGDPRGDGWGGPGFTLTDEPTIVPFDSWRVGIATSGPHTGGCQLFMTLLPADRLTGHYSNLGEVIGGREVLTRLEVGDRIHRISALEGGADELPPLTATGRATAGP